MRSLAKHLSREKREALRRNKAVAAGSLGYAFVIATDVLGLVKFPIHPPTVLVSILELTITTFFFFMLILAVIRRRRDLISIYIFFTFVHSQFRVLIAATAMLVASFPQTLLLALPAEYQAKRSQVRMIWVIIAIGSVFVWVFEMLASYFALRYRSYLPRRRYQADRHPVLFAATTTGATTTNGVEAGISGKEMQVVCGKESDLISAKQLPQVPGKESPISGKQSQPVSGKELQPTPGKQS